ncbi:MAG: PAS domain S-box protein [Acidobacteria bacterium]|nr:PAS domain S-box protein [Acidobacteriota bacterium]
MFFAKRTDNSRNKKLPALMRRLRGRVSRLRREGAFRQQILEALPDGVYRIIRRYSDWQVDVLQPLYTGMKSESGPQRFEPLAQLGLRIALEQVMTADLPGQVRLVEYAVEDVSTPMFHEARLVLTPRREILAVIRDITRRKQAERQLEVERNFVSAILDHSAAFILVMDATGRILRICRNCERMLRRQFTDTVGCGFWELILPREHWVECQALFQRIICGETTAELELPLASEGDRRMILWSFTAIRRAADEVEFIIATGIDHTEKRELLEEREKLIRQLQQAMAEIRQLSGLIPICANCKKIRDDDGFWHQVEEYISRHSPVEFSHGICPECIRRLYPEYYKARFPDAGE